MLELVYRWNSGWLDTVWVLGCFVWQTFISTFIFIKMEQEIDFGNHDHYQLSLYQQHFSRFGAF